MKLIKESFLKTCTPTSSKAGKWLKSWTAVIKYSEWKNINDLQKVYPSAGSVKVASGRSVSIFNVCGNDYRLITALHYDKQRVYTLEFLPHAEYDKNKWKQNL